MEYLTKIAQSILLKNAQAHGYKIDVSKVKVFKVFQQDIDGDGQAEICFAAGIPDLWDNSTCVLLDSQGEQHRIIELVPLANGFRDLEILDINKDGTPEIIARWQVGSDARLSLYIFQWDGEVVKSLFPQYRENGFHQGFVELKDLDADGVDEIVIWEGEWDQGVPWGPKRFDIYVFYYNDNVYELRATQTSDYRYDPSNIVSREIGIFGLPVAFEHRAVSVEEYHQRLLALIQNQQVTEEFVDELGKHLSVLQYEGFYIEVLAIADLALEATEHLSESSAKAAWRVALWRDKGVTHSLLGDYPTAIKCHLQSLSNWSEGVNARSSSSYIYPDFQRELGYMYSMVGDYEHALAYLFTAKTLIEDLDLTVEGNRSKLSYVYFNFGLTYARLGEYDLAIASFEKAIAFNRKGNYFGFAVNYMWLGNIQRSLKKYQQAIQSYQAALKALDETPDRDRESDVYLELGLTLILNRQLEQGLQYLHKALLLTSMGNLKQREAIHYLYLGEAYKQLNDLQLAAQFFHKAITLAEEFETPETKWQALYGLALTYQRQGQTISCQQVLETAIETIEQLRSQYLPETLKISLFAEKTKPYEAMILLYRQTSSEQAFDYMERIKSRVFIEQLATTTMGSATGIPSELAEQEARLIGEIRRLQLRHRETLSQQKYEWGDEIAKIEGQLEQLWHEIRSTDAKGAEYIALRQATPLDFARVKQIINTP